MPMALDPTRQITVDKVLDPDRSRLLIFSVHCEEVFVFVLAQISRGKRKDDGTK